MAALSDAWQQKRLCRGGANPSAASNHTRKTSQSQWAGPTPAHIMIAVATAFVSLAVPVRFRRLSPITFYKFLLAMPGFSGCCGGGSQPGIDIPRNPVQLRKPSPVRCPLRRRTWFGPPDKPREEDRHHPKKHPFRTAGAFCLRRAKWTINKAKK